MRFQWNGKMMNKKELLKLIEKGEGETAEFKESLKLLNEIGETISAFSNSNSGIILIGVSDSGKIIMVSIGKNTVEELANYIKRNTDPQIYPSVNVEELENKKIILIEVLESKEKPVFFKNHAYKRVGKTNLELSSSEIRKLAKESGEKVYWDEQIYTGAIIGDIDEKKIKWFVKEARKQRGLGLSETLPTRDILMKLKLSKNKKLTNACILLFSKEPKFLQSEVKCIRFSGNEPIKPYIDFQTLEGDVFSLINQAEDFVLRNIRKSIWLVPGQVQREEKYEYPPDAIREAIINAIVHRDYESPSKVQVRIFDNRIEVWSPGLLPKEITIEDLKKEHRSIPRNPLLFKQLFWVKFVEDVGGGTLDMIKQCKEWGIPEPEFKFITGAFVVVFRLPPSLEDLEKLGLNKRQIKAVDYVVKKGLINNKEYQELNNVSKRTATLDLKGLINKSVFKKIGKGKRDTKYILLGKSIQKVSKKVSKKEYN